MSEKNFAITVYVITSIVCISFLMIGIWELERWINWKFSYGPRVEERISQLEKRVEKLEQK